MRKQLLQAVEADFVQLAASVAALTEQQAVEARGLAAAVAIAPGSPQLHTCSVSVPAVGAAAHILEAVSTLLHYLPPSVSSSYAAWTAS